MDDLVENDDDKREDEGVLPMVVVVARTNEIHTNAERGRTDLTASLRKLKAKDRGESTNFQHLMVFFP